MVAAMTYEKFRAELIAAGLTLREFAELLKFNPNSVTNYKSLGEVPDHIAVIASLMHELVKRGGDFRPAIKRAHVRRKAPRGKSIG